MRRYAEFDNIHTIVLWVPIYQRIDRRILHLQRRADAGADCGTLINGIQRRFWGPHMTSIMR